MYGEINFALHLWNIPGMHPGQGTTGEVTTERMVFLH